MNVWTIDKDFSVDVSDAPEWATQLAWRYFEVFGERHIIRAWVNEDDTKYQYLKNFSGFDSHETIFNNQWINDPVWRHPAFVIGTRLPQDDALPPVVNTIHMFERASVHVERSVKINHDVYLGIWPKRDDYNDVQGVHMTADDALALAHDIMRMAMEAKRRG